MKRPLRSKASSPRCRSRSRSKASIPRCRSRSKASIPRCRSRSKSRRAGEGRRRLGYEENFPGGQPKEVLKADIEPRTKKVAYTLVEFWTDLKMIWNFIFECFREKNHRRKNILRKRQIWVKKCKYMMEKWRQETNKRRSMLGGKSTIPIVEAKRNKERKGEEREGRQYVLRSGYDYTLEVGPHAGAKKTAHLTATDGRFYGGSREQGGSKNSKFKNLPPNYSHIKDIPKMTTSSRLQKIGKRRKMREAAEPRCSLCLATGGHLARCSGCRSIR